VFGLALALGATVGLGPAAAQDPVAPPIDDDGVNRTEPVPRIRSGAWELNLGGSVSNTNGVTYGSFDARAGTFRPAGKGLLGLETLVSYSHYGGDDYGDLQEWVTYQRGYDGTFLGAGRDGLWPYVGVGAGVSRGWAEPEAYTSYPVGFVLGARLLQGRTSAARVEYRVRHYFGSPEPNPTHGGWFVGYSFFLNNFVQR
jgi:hypothetical protein